MVVYHTHVCEWISTNFWAHRCGRNIDQSTSSAGPAQAAFNRLKMGTRQGEEQAAPEMLVEKVLFAIKVGSRTTDPNRCEILRVINE